jgi:hypothetical protein
MNSEHRSLIYIVFSILILSLIATVFALRILLFVEIDQFRVNTAAQTANIDHL